MTPADPPAPDTSSVRPVRVVTAPSAILLARQVLREVGVCVLLDDAGAPDWGTDTDQEAEALVEIAGRTCYQSFGAPRPGGNAAYIDHVLQVGHGSVIEHANWTFAFVGVSRSLTHELVRHRAGMAYCLDGSTEVWGGGGSNGKWNGAKKWTLRKLYRMSKDPVRKARIPQMKVRCFDGDQFVSVPIKAVAKSGIKKVYDVTLSDGKTVRCSKDHRFLTTDGWRALRHIGVGEVLATNGLPSIGLQKDWLRTKYLEENLMASEVARLAGCSTETVLKWVGIYGLRKGRGKGQLGRPAWNKGKRYKAGWKHSDATKAVLAAQKTGENNPGWTGDQATAQAGRFRAQKMFPTEPCEACGVEQGHRHHKDRNTVNNVRDNIEFLCGSCHKLRHNEEDGPSHVLRVKWLEVVSVQYAGEKMTYDLEVDHPAHNFVANGFVTHNSQLSQRYVDESGRSAAVVPACVAADPIALSIWEDSVNRSQNAYNRLCARLLTLAATRGLEGVKTQGEGGKRQVTTDDKKAARGAARSVLTNSSETKIVVTGNARAWRHFLEQRCHPAADREIRDLAFAVYQVLVVEAPNLFRDYQTVLHSDGGSFLHTAYRKV